VTIKVSCHRPLSRRLLKRTLHVLFQPDLSRATDSFASLSLTAQCKVG
jgi:hypothetical protein